jgi:hypothetical protein
MARANSSAPGGAGPSHRRRRTSFTETSDDRDPHRRPRGRAALARRGESIPAPRACRRGRAARRADHGRPHACRGRDTALAGHSDLAHRPRRLAERRGNRADPAGAGAKRRCRAARLGVRSSGTDRRSRLLVRRRFRSGEAGRGTEHIPYAGARISGIEIDVVAGYGDAADVPEPLRQAIRLLVAHWFEDRMLVGAAEAPLPKTVDALIAPYRVLP